jgi:hypothetical protein
MQILMVLDNVQSKQLYWEYKDGVWVDTNRCEQLPNMAVAYIAVRIAKEKG